MTFQITITEAIERKLIRAANESPCKRDRRGAVLVADYGNCIEVVGRGYNSPPRGQICGEVVCVPSCSRRAEHAEVMAIRNTVLNGDTPRGTDIVHGRVVDGEIVASRPPREKACISCAVQMLAWCVGGIWLYVYQYVDGKLTTRARWTRWTTAEYYRFAVHHAQPRPPLISLKSTIRAAGDLATIVEQLLDITGVESPADLVEWAQDASRLAGFSDIKVENEVTDV